MKTVYLTIGHIGSGKSTWAKNYVDNHPDTKIVCADNFRTMLNGTYKYLEELDDIITESMVNTATHLLNGGYNVIIDVGNITNERRSSWLNLPADKKVAILLPRENAEWHVANRETNPHWGAVDWYAIFQGESNVFDDVDANDFDEIINVEKW